MDNTEQQIYCRKCGFSNTGQQTACRKCGFDNTGQQTYCRRCGKEHAILKYDGQVLQIGNVQIFNSIRYSCVCGFSATWFASPIQDDRKGFDDATRKVLNKLGKKQTGRPSRIADNFDDDFEG